MGSSKELYKDVRMKMVNFHQDGEGYKNLVFQTAYFHCQKHYYKMEDGSSPGTITLSWWRGLCVPMNLGAGFSW